MSDRFALAADPRESVEIRVRGRVQGVGFRPTVWRYARDCDLDGEVLNDGEGVLIRVCGSPEDVERFVARLRAAPPPLAAIAAIEVTMADRRPERGFRIAQSAPGAARTEIAPDAAVCAACTQEISDPLARRYRYPFTNCTHCGPRLTILRSVPYDRAATTMAPFAMCKDCAREYADPADRRFHAEPIACPCCGPRARLIRLDGGDLSAERPCGGDEVEAAIDLIQQGQIVAVKALGGYQIACDATNQDSLARLRELKRRDAKPFALMARDIEVIRRYCAVSPQEEAALRSPAAPIVLLDATGPERLPEAIAPGLRTLGFMLPATPLHALLLRQMSRPVIMTSGNRSDEPQIIEDRQAGEALAAIAPYALVHDRAIANRLDDSVARWSGGQIRLLRRARGHAPASIPLPQGFEQAPEILAYGPQMKATFCLLKEGRAVLSQHQGDLDNAATWADYRQNLDLFCALFGHAPQALACDMHPEYLSTRLAMERARADGLPLVKAQHHHAHLVSCLAENGRPLAAPAVLGIALDGLGYGAEGTLWGGEFLLFDYRGFERLGTFRPVAMPGGERAAREPWRNLYAHLMAQMGWASFASRCEGLDLFQKLSGKPRATIDAMIRTQTNSPLASSCGRLFDAVAALLDLCFERQAYEGEAAARLEAIACRQTLAQEDDGLAYPLPILNRAGSGLACIEPLEMWNALLDDRIRGTAPSVIAARFHKGLAQALVAMALRLADRGEAGAAAPRFDTVALSGGCFQNRILLEETLRRLEAKGFKVLSHAAVPANDGGVALGQVAIAAAQLIDKNIFRRQGA